MGSNDRTWLLRDSEMTYRHSELIVYQCIHCSLKSYCNTVIEWLCAQVYRLRYHVPKDWVLVVLLNVRVEKGTCPQSALKVWFGLETGNEPRHLQMLSTLSTTEAQLLHSCTFLYHNRAFCKLRQQAGHQNSKGGASSSHCLGQDVLVTSLVVVARYLTTAA